MRAYCVINIILSTSYVLNHSILKIALEVGINYCCPILRMRKEMFRQMLKLRDVIYVCVCVCVCLLSCSVVFDSLWPYGVQPTRLLCPWGVSKQEYWNGLPCPPPGDLPNPGIEPRSPTLQVNSLLSEPPGKPTNGSGQPIPSPGHLSDPGIELGSPALQAGSLPAKLPGKPQETLQNMP